MVTSDDDAPGTPTLDLLVAGDELVTLSWSPGTEGTEATSLYFQYQMTSTTSMNDADFEDAEWVTIARNDDDENPEQYEVTGLTNGRDYYFRMRAISDAGESDPTAASTAVTPIAS